MPAKPTPAQMAFLRNLADRTGTTFEHPATARAARAQIDKLRAALPSCNAEPDDERDAEREAERDDVSRALADGPSSSVRDSEIDGYGSSAHWGTRSRRPVEDDAPRGDERCSAIRDYPNPYHHGYPVGEGKVMSRADARRAYKRMLWERMKADPAFVAILAALDGTLTSCHCRVHPCEREDLGDAAAYATSMAA